MEVTSLQVLLGIILIVILICYIPILILIIILWRGYSNSSTNQKVISQETLVVTKAYDNNKKEDKLVVQTKELPETHVIIESRKFEEMSEGEKNWIILREKAFKLYGKKCKECGSISNIDVHHILHRSVGGKDELENLEILCRECHEKYHGYAITHDWKPYQEIMITNNKMKLLLSATEHQYQVIFDYTDYEKVQSVQKAKASKCKFEKPSDIAFVRSVLTKDQIDKMDKAPPKLYFLAYSSEDGKIKRYRVSRMENIKII